MQDIGLIESEQYRQKVMIRVFVDYVVVFV